MRQNPHVRICGGPGSATTLVYPTSDGGGDLLLGKSSSGRASPRVGASPRGVGAQLSRPVPERPVGDSPRIRPAAHNQVMKSRVHPKYKTKYHVRNWASYERALVERGDVTVWLSPDAIAAWKPEAGSTGWAAEVLGSRHRNRLDAAPPLSPSAEGFLTSLFRLMGLNLRVPITRRSPDAGSTST